MVYDGVLEHTRIVECKMRFRIPRGITKDQIYVTVILGLITGYYTWQLPIQEYLIAQKNKQDQISNNEVITN